MRRTTFEATKTGQIKMQREELLQPMRFREGIGQAESKWFPLLNERRIATTVEPLMKSLRLRSERPGDVPPPFCPKCLNGVFWPCPPVPIALVVPHFLKRFLLEELLREPEIASVARAELTQRSIAEDRQIAHTCIDNPILPCANPFCGHKAITP
jgi:hypothetical protein